MIHYFKDVLRQLKKQFQVTSTGFNYLFSASHLTNSMFSFIFTSIPVKHKVMMTEKKTTITKIQLFTPIFLCVMNVKILSIENWRPLFQFVYKFPNHLFPSHVNRDIFGIRKKSFPFDCDKDVVLEMTKPLSYLSRILYYMNKQ